jgi:hypothetical protein
LSFLVALTVLSLPPLLVETYDVVELMDMRSKSSATLAGVGAVLLLAALLPATLGDFLVEAAALSDFVLEGKLVPPPPAVGTPS